jgi:hypothetical protein
VCPASLGAFAISRWRAARAVIGHRARGSAHRDLPLHSTLDDAALIHEMNELRRWLAGPENQRSSADRNLASQAMSRAGAELHRRHPLSRRAPPAAQKPRASNMLPAAPLFRRFQPKTVVGEKTRSADELIAGTRAELQQHRDSVHLKNLRRAARHRDGDDVDAQKTMQRDATLWTD